MASSALSFERQAEEKRYSYKNLSSPSQSNKVTIKYKPIMTWYPTEARIAVVSRPMEEFPPVTMQVSPVLLPHNDIAFFNCIHKKKYKNVLF
jgi:hypothetical protein